MFWGLYRTLSNVASDGLLTEGFYWIPSLSGPITVAQQRAGMAAALYNAKSEHSEQGLLSLLLASHHLCKITLSVHSGLDHQACHISN